jgi:hypothetical protein
MAAASPRPASAAAYPRNTGHRVASAAGASRIGPPCTRTVTGVGPTRFDGR